MGAAFGWQRDRSVEEWLYREPYRFEFVQAIRLLEQLAGDAEPLADGVNPAAEPVRLRSNISQSFPASEVEELTPGEDGPPELTLNVLSLAGAHGPLPPPYTELILERIWRGDVGIRDFLDIFHHRLLSMMYRMRTMNRVWLTNRRPDETPVGEYLYSLIGLASPATRNRMHVPDRAMLFYAGLFSSRSRSAIGLQQILSDYFRVKVDVRQFRGGWRFLQRDEWTSVGTRGRNNSLGRNMVLGFRMWDQQTRFGIQIGPLSLDEFMQFLPNGRAFPKLQDMVRFYAGEGQEVRVRLGIAPNQMPPNVLGKSRLGWTSWLKQSPREDWQVELRLNVVSTGN